jgi:hypothetical protein
MSNKSNKNKHTVVKAFRLILDPLVRILLRSGVTWKEASEVCKATFVDVATREFGLHGRPTNISRVSIMTGLGRRDVSRLRKSLADEEPVDLAPMNRATRVLAGWHTNPDFLTPSGKPRDIRFEEGRFNFSMLAGQYAGDIAPVTMLRELIRVGAVLEKPNGLLRAVKRYYMPLSVDPEAVYRAGSVLEDLGNTIDYNLVREPDAPTRFEGRATNFNIRAVDEKAFRAFLEEEGQGFLERADDWLTQHESSQEIQGKYRIVKLGVGVYQIRDDRH